MKTNPLGKALGSRAVFLATAALSLGSVWAQAPDYEYNYNGYPPPPGYGPAPAYPPEGYAPPPYYAEDDRSPLEVIPEIRRRFSETFRRLFYGERGYDAPMPGSRGRSLDEPPPYSSHYDGPSTGMTVPPEYGPRSGREAYRYERPPAPRPRYRNEIEEPRYQASPEAPRYQAPPEAPRYQTPPNRYQPPAPSPAPSSKSKSDAASSKSSASKKKVESSPPKNYTPPTITRKSPSQPKESPPSSPAETDYSFSPGTKSSSKADSPPASKSSSESKTASSGSAPGASKGSAGTASSGSFLRGKRTAKAGRVTSPYPPYQELDVTGLASGSLALDPTTQKVFEVP